MALYLRGYGNILSLLPIGTAHRGLSSTEDQENVDPNNIPSHKWQYYTGETWSYSNKDEVIIKCKGNDRFNNSKIHSLHSLAHKKKM